MIKLTVAMITYNREKYISKAIESVLNQTYKNFKFIILDNCSTDNTGDIIKNFNSPKINYIKNDKNIGFVGNLNKALDICDTEYLIIVHDDDILKDDLLEKEINILEKDKDISLVGANRIYIDENGISKGKLYELDEDIVYEKFQYIEQGLTLCMPTVMFRMNFIKNNNLRFNSYVGEVSDTLFWYEVNLLDTKIHFIKEPLIYYRQHSNQGCFNKEKMIRSTMRLFEVMLKKIHGSDISLINKNKIINKLENVFINEALKSLDIKDCNSMLFNKLCSFMLENHILTHESNSNIYSKYVLNLLLDKDDKNSNNKIDLKKISLEYYNWTYKLQKGEHIFSDKCGKNGKIAIFGTKANAFLIYKQCIKDGIKVKCFLDSFCDKEYKFTDEIFVCNISYLENLSDIDIILVSVESDKSFIEIKNQLIKYAKNIQIVWWKDCID